MATIPSIAMIPSGVKASKLYSVLPTDGTGDFTTTRASVATRVNENGLIEEVAANVPRLDYSDGTCPSLLLEPASTNLVVQSELFSDASWTKARSATTSSVGIDPSGLSNSYTLEATGTSQPNISNYDNWTDNTEYAFSCFIKPNFGDYAFLGVYGNVIGDSWLRIDLTDNSLSYDGTGFSNGKVDVFENGWIRLSVEYISTSINASRSRFKIGLSTLGSFSSGVIGDKIDIYGAQLEENSYATSYIKNAGTALGVTRVADTATGSGSSTVINSSEGTLYAEMGFIGDESVGQLSINDGSFNESVKFLYLNSTTLRVEMKTASGANFVEDITVVTGGGVFDKVAIRYKSNDYAVYHNGIAQTVVQTSAVTSGLNALSFNQGSNSAPFYGKIKSVQVYTTALSDAELTSLTTI